MDGRKQNLIWLIFIESYKGMDLFIEALDSVYRISLIFVDLNKYNLFINQIKRINFHQVKYFVEISEANLTEVINL